MLPWQPDLWVIWGVAQRRPRGPAPRHSFPAPWPWFLKPSLRLSTPEWWGCSESCRHESGKASYGLGFLFSSFGKQPHIFHLKDRGKGKVRTETPNKQNPRKTTIYCVTQAPSPWCSCLPRAARGFPDPPRSSAQVWEPGTTPSSTSCKASHLNHGMLGVFEMRTPRELKTIARIRFRECRHISSFQQRAGSNSTRTTGIEWDGAHSMWFCSRLVKWQLRRPGHSPRRTKSPRKEPRLNTGMTLTWTQQVLWYSLRSRGICIPPRGSRWATPGFVRETH